MSKKTSWLTGKFMSCIATAGALFLLGNASGSAQTFQYTYGGVGNDAATGGVVALATNEFVTVGHSRSFGLANDDIYLIKTNACGALIWSFTYDLGGNDVAHKIRNTPDGGFIIVGETENLRNCCTRNDIFLMKVDATGAFTWARTYGGNGVELGNDVQLLPDGYVVAGRTNSFGQGSDDAYLMRTDLLGSIATPGTWARTHGGTNSDFYLSCDVAANGDIIALGSTNSFGAGGYDLYLTRSSQATGCPINTWRYGGAAIEIGWSVIEDAAGAIVMAGGTGSLGGNNEGLLLKVNGTTGAFLCGTAYGGSNGTGWDEFLEVRETANGYLVTGILFNVPGGFGNYDMYVGNVGPCFGPINHTVHGGTGDDRGYSIAEAPGAPAPESIIAGYTTSFGFGGQDVYLVRQRANGTSGCNDAVPQLIAKVPSFSPNPTTTVCGVVNVECAATATPISRTAQRVLCTSCLPPTLDAPALDTPALSEDIAAPAGKALNNR